MDRAEELLREVERRGGNGYDRGADPLAARRPADQPGPANDARVSQAHDWPEPIDILADPQLTGLATVDATCLPRSILALATAEGARLQVDPCHIAALTIGATSAVISDHWRVRLKVNDHGWTQHASIWIAVVAESGRKKTDCFRAATRGVSNIERKLRDEHTRKLAGVPSARQRPSWRPASLL